MADPAPPPPSHPAASAPMPPSHPAASAPTPPTRAWDGGVLSCCGGTPNATSAGVCVATACGWGPLFWGINQARAFGDSPCRASLLTAALCLGAPLYVPYVALGAWRRGQLRARHGLPGSTAGDVLYWACLSPCATCQETRTLEVNGVRDGMWGAAPPEVRTVPPPVEGGMTK